MKSSPILLLACAVTATLAGCGSTEESAEEKPQAPPQQRPAQVPARRLEFETRTDTVTAVHGADRKPEGVPGRQVQVRYMVQIGAFKDAHRASEVQSTARKRYKMPVLNDFHTARALYQIRLGFFESRESAHAFRQRMMREFPSEYSDSWVVQLKR